MSQTGTDLGEVALRLPTDDDHDPIFAMMKDRAAVRMAAFTHEDPYDRARFDDWLSRVRSNAENTFYAITVGGVFAGTIGSYVNEGGDAEVTYWIDRLLWGRGVASNALQLLLAELPTRPIHARVAADNVASQRVLEKAGFRRVGADRGYAAGRGEETDELIFRRDYDPN